VLQAVFGDKETIRQRHPISFLICPQSPLIIEEKHTDAYLEMIGYDIPTVIMPMPMMGATAPGSMIGTVIQGNCEVLSMLCLIQAAAPGNPVLYSPSLAIINPRDGRYAGGAIEGGLLSVAAVEMGRYYNLPVENTGIGTDHFVPGIQAGYEKAMTTLLQTAAWPDILMGAGLLGSATLLSLEQIIIDAEVFRLSKQASRGIPTGDSKWLDDVIAEIGPGGDYLAEMSTVKGIRGGEWYINQLGVHQSYEIWEAKGKPSLLDEAREKVDHVLETHKPLPLGEDIERELDKIEARALSMV
jgi:trimethylamine---corrinoid protein Co-methyltransferase